MSELSNHKENKYKILVQLYKIQKMILKSHEKTTSFDPLLEDLEAIIKKTESLYSKA